MRIYILLSLCTLLQPSTSNHLIWKKLKRNKYVPSAILEPVQNENKFVSRLLEQLSFLELGYHLNDKHNERGTKKTQAQKNEFPLYKNLANDFKFISPLKSNYYPKNKKKYHRHNHKINYQNVLFKNRYKIKENDIPKPYRMKSIRNKFENNKVNQFGSQKIKSNIFGDVNSNEINFEEERQFSNPKFNLPFEHDIAKNQFMTENNLDSSYFDKNSIYLTNKYSSQPFSPYKTNVVDDFDDRLFFVHSDEKSSPKYKNHATHRNHLVSDYSFQHIDKPLPFSYKEAFDENKIIRPHHKDQTNSIRHTSNVKILPHTYADLNHENKSKGHQNEQNHYQINWVETDKEGDKLNINHHSIGKRAISASEGTANEHDTFVWYCGHIKGLPGILEHDTSDEKRCAFRREFIDCIVNCHKMQDARDEFESEHKSGGRPPPPTNFCKMENSHIFKIQDFKNKIRNLLSAKENSCLKQFATGSF